jgi:hypothetical protein
VAKLTGWEQETHLNLIAADRSVWEVFTDDPVMVGKFDKMVEGDHIEFVRTVGEGKAYRIPFNQISFRSKSSGKPRSEAQIAHSRKQAARFRGE